MVEVFQLPQQIYRPADRGFRQGLAGRRGEQLVQLFEHKIIIAASRISSQLTQPNNSAFTTHLAQYSPQRIQIDNFTSAQSISLPSHLLSLQTNHSKLENIIKKTNLGIAVQQAISELGLERERTKIMTYLQKSFEEKYEEFKKTVSNNTGTLKGYYVTDNEFPIGEHDKQQYFRSVAFQAKINSTSLTTTSGGEKKPFTLIEGYSRNDESKKRNYSKAHGKSEKKVGETAGKKKTKK